MRLLMQLSGKCQKIRNRNKSWHKHKIIVSANKLARSTLSLYIKKLLRSVPITRRNTVFLFAAVAMLFWNLVGLVYPIYDAIVLGYPLGLDVLFFSDMQWFWPYFCACYFSVLLACALASKTRFEEGRLHALVHIKAKP